MQEMVAKPGTRLMLDIPKGMEVSIPRGVPVTGLPVTPPVALPDLAMPTLVVRPESFLPVEDELLILGALEALKGANDTLKIVYQPQSPEVAALFSRRPWFLERADRVKNGFDVTLGEPDPQAVEVAERAAYDQWHQTAVAQVRAQMQQMQAAGVKDVQIPEPPHHFIAHWHKSNGFLWTLVEQLGIRVSLPVGVALPWAHPGKDALKEATRPLFKARMLDRPFLVYDFPEGVDRLELGTILQQRFAHLSLVNLAELRRMATAEVVHLAALFSHPHCKAAILPEGKAATVAWASGLPAMVVFYGGTNSLWDAPQAAQFCLLDMNRFTPEQLPIALSQAGLQLAAKL